MNITNLKIDMEFASKIPPLTGEELMRLHESILTEGRCISPIVVWDGVIVDGHNRYRFLSRHPEIEYTVYEKDFLDRNDAIAWICKNQLGRRNLTPEQKKYLIGKQYEAEKQALGGDRKSEVAKSMYQNETLIEGKNTGERIARENNVSRISVIRAEKYATAVDLAEEAIPGIKDEILSGAIHATDTEIIKIANAAPDKRPALIEKLREPKQPKPKTERTKGITFNKKYYENPEDLVPSSRPDKEPPISAVLMELGAVVDDFMLTVRPLDEQGKWQYKTEKEYLCVKNGEERGFTAAEFKTAQADGWEKQYPYKVGRKKVYMPPSEAEKHGYERASKHPKSTKFGRQNPIAEHWNSEEQLVQWRKEWADVTNRYLEQYGHDARIDHRSHADRGLSEQPTIHEGVVARALEKKGIISDRCEINRQIKADNALLRELKATVKKLMQAVKNTVPAIAEAMEKLRGNMLIFSYQLRHIGAGKHNIGKRIDAVKPELERYAGLVRQIKEKSKERKSLVAEKKATPIYQPKKLYDLTRRIAELTEELEELKSEKAMLLNSLDCADDADISTVKKEIDTLESGLKKLEEQETKYSAELDDALKQYAELKEQAADMDSVELMDARLDIRKEQERSAIDRVKAAYGKKYDFSMMAGCKQDVASLLHEEIEIRSVREKLLQRRQQAQQKQTPKKHRDSYER